MTENYFVASSGILGIRTNLAQFKWSFGITVPPGSKSDYEQCAVKMCVVRDPSAFSSESDRLNGKYHYFSGLDGEDRITYDRNFVCGQRLRLEVAGLTSDEPMIRVNPTYLRWVSHRFMNLHSLGYILTDLAGILLLRKHYSPLHCSAFKYGQAVVAVVAPPNTGKTLTAIQACLEYGTQFLAEDLAITDGTTIYSVPWTSTFRYYKGIDRRWSSRLRAKLTNWFPPLELLSPKSPTPITKVVPADQILSRARATHIVILARGPSSIETLSANEATRCIQNLNRYEFNYHKAPLVVAAEYFNSSIDISGACRREQEILRHLASSTQCIVVRENDPTVYAQRIMEHLDRNHARDAA